MNRAPQTHELPPHVRFEATRDRKLESLIGALLRGTCVPFLGAGMSWAADPDAHRLRTCHLQTRLRTRLRGLADDRGAVPDEVLRSAEGLGLSQLAELLWRYFGLREAVEAMGLETWDDVQPTDAHRYLAFLARERLITEVITTNYDCLVETALVESRAPAVPSREWPKVTPLAIRSLEEYRRDGGRRGGPGTVLLHVIKLNGCAWEFRDAWDRRNQCEETRQAYERVVARIAVTERQLQDWRTSVWSEQMFRDRVRTRRLVFVGFGSEDPMVRHTMMQVSEEFASAALGQGSAATGTDKPCPPCQLPNAPFIAELSELKDTQRQVLAGFCLAHPCGRRKRDQPESSGIEGGIRANACARDLGDSQSADEFWRELYIRSIRRLWIERYFSEDSALARYVAPLLHSADNVLAAVREVLAAPDGGGQSPTRCFWKAFAAALSLGPDGLSELGRAHLAAAGSTPPYQPGQYVAISDEPVGVPMMYLLWVLFHNAIRLRSHGTSDLLPLDLPEEFPSPSASGAWIGQLRTDSPSGQPRKVLCRFGDPGIDLSQPTAGTEEEGNHVLLITLDGRRRRPRRILRRGLQFAPGPTAGDDYNQCGSMRPQIVFVVPDALLLSRASAEHRRSGLRGLLERLHELLADPEQLRDQGDTWEDWCEPRHSDAMSAG